MLKRSYRLKKRDIKRVYQKGKKQFFPNLNIKFLPNRALHYRAAVVIPKAVLKKATDRNRLKRKTNEILQSMSLPEFDIIISFKSPVKEENLKEKIEEAFRNIKF